MLLSERPNDQRVFSAEMAKGGGVADSRRPRRILIEEGGGGGTPAKDIAVDIVADGELPSELLLSLEALSISAPGGEDVE